MDVIFGSGEGFERDRSRFEWDCEGFERDRSRFERDCEGAPVAWAYL
jgi:hypothetical protein